MKINNVKKIIIGFSFCFAIISLFFLYRDNSYFLLYLSSLDFQIESLKYDIDTFYYTYRYTIYVAVLFIGLGITILLLFLMRTYTPPTEYP